MNAKYVGRAVVLVVVLVLVLSVPILADSGEIHEQYQWVMEQIQAGESANWRNPPGEEPGRPPGLPVVPPKIVIPSGLAYEQYQEALKQMELDIQNAVPNPGGAGKPHPKPHPFNDSSVTFGQYLWALESMEKAIQEAVPNE